VEEARQKRKPKKIKEISDNQRFFGPIQCLISFDILGWFLILLTNFGHNLGTIPGSELRIPPFVQRGNEIE
jgi:hypothetical protein